MYTKNRAAWLNFLTDLGEDNLHDDFALPDQSTDLRRCVESFNSEGVCRREPCEVDA